MTHSDICKRRSPKTILLSSIILITGLIIILITDNVPLDIVALLLILSAPLCFFCTRKEYVYLPTNKAMYSRELYYKSSEVEILKNILAEKDFKKLLIIPNDPYGIKMLVLMTKNKQFALVQLFEYVPYEYKAISEQIVCLPKDAVYLDSVINK